MSVIDKNVNIYFVRVKASHVWHKGMKKAFSGCKRIGITPEWIKPEDLLNSTLAANSVLVFADFSGPHFEQYREEDVVITGADCLLKCINEEIPIPENESPVFNLAMKDLVISTSRMLKSKKKNIRELVSFMGASYTNDLTEAVTHLIAESNLSAKCASCAEKKIPILHPDWVTSSWETSQQNIDFKAIDLCEKYRNPVFLGIEISLSNMDTRTKNKYNKLIESNGGKCNPRLVQKETHIVVSDKCHGEKVRCAIAWELPCVTSQWLENSVTAGAALPTSSYQIKLRPTCSTPTSDLPSFMDSADISAVNVGSLGSSSQVIEDSVAGTQFSVASTSTRDSLFVRPTPQYPQVKPVHVSDEENILSVSDLDMAAASSAGCFLDGCKMYLGGWPQKESDKLKKMVIWGGATVLTQPSDMVTHILVNDTRQQENKQLLSSATNACLVDLKWIQDSIANKAPVTVLPQVSATTPSRLPPPSPLSSKGAQLLKSSEKSKSSTQTPSVARKLFSNVKESSSQSEVGRSTMTDDLKMSNGGSGNANGGNDNANDCNGNDAPLPSTSLLDNSSAPNQRIFEGIDVMVIGFKSDNIDETLSVIENHGGRVLPANSEAIPDYAVVPVEGVGHKLQAKHIVNPFWLEDCLEAGHLVELEYFHKSVFIVAPRTCLSGCVICFSGFLGKERHFLTCIAVLLGALVQECFSRKDNPLKNIYKCTHLVTLEASGSKYEAAKKWGFPAVGRNWLLKATTCEKAPDADGYSIDNTEKNNQLEFVENPLHFENGNEVNTDAANLADLSDEAEKEDKENISANHPKDRNSSKKSESFVPAMEELGSSRIARSFHSSDKDSSCSKKNSSKFEVDRKKPEEVTAGTTMSEITKEEQPFASRVDVLDSVTPTNNLNDLGLPLEKSARRSLKRPCSIVGPQNCSKVMKTPVDQRLEALRDSPNTSLGNQSTDSPNTREQWRVYFDGFPNIRPSPSNRRQSTPLSVLKKQFFDAIASESNSPSGNGSDTPTTSKLSSGQKRLQENSSDSSQEKRRSQAVNDLMNMMSEMQRSDVNGDEAAPKQEVDKRVVDALQRRPSDVSSNANHPLNKMRPSRPDSLEVEIPANTEGYKDDEPSTSKESNVSQHQKKANMSSFMSSPSSFVEQSAKPVKRFLISSLPDEVKEKYMGIVNSLGGEMASTSKYDDTCTHLVMLRPVRNEKFLCAIAAGKWVLHTSYLDQCYEARHFLPEEEYEWGNPRSESKLPQLEPGSQEYDLARAAHRWRKKCSNLNQRAFRHWKACLLIRKSSVPMFQRMLEAGGATIVKDPVDSSICLIEEDHVEVPSNLPLLVSQRIPVVPLIFISIFLSEHSAIDPKQYVISAYKELLET